TYTYRPSEPRFCPSPRRATTQGFDPWGVARGHEGAHVQHGTYMRAASPHGPPAPQGPTVTMQGRDAHSRRDLLPRERPQLREFEQPRPGTNRPHPWGPRPQIVFCPPHWAGSDQRLEVVV